MKDELKNTVNFDGATGRFSITEKGTAKRKFTFKKVVDGKFQIF